ncbi:GNAT family N-acetyltransferase [Magnetovibrio sp.]|uniref:GNAT family N-acetyltransferase n=1 Tax=Magnetovibrio sp. TaxID=2024836 RepID=UPI002F93A7EC
MIEMPAAFYLVALGLTHAEVLAVLHAESFSDGWSAASFDTTLRMPGAYGFMAVRHGDDEPLGFALFRAGGGEAEVLTVATRPFARGQGIASALMTQGLSLAKDLGAETMFLEVAADNASALRLYQALGFVQTGQRKGYYARAEGPPVDALVMARTN